MCKYTDQRYISYAFFIFLIVVDVASLLLGLNYIYLKKRVVKVLLSDFLLSQKEARLGKWNFKGWVYRLKYVIGRCFEVPTSTASLSWGPWPLMTFRNLCIIKVKPCKIYSLLEWSTRKLFSASQLCPIPIYKVFKICKYISQILKKKNNINMAQNSTQITGITFS